MPEPVGRACLKCGRDGPSWMLRACPICGRMVCVKCATFAYGRHFCSRRCGEYFFHGEGEDEEPEET